MLALCTHPFVLFSLNKAHQVETSFYNYGEKSGLNEMENIKDTGQRLMLLQFLVLNGACVVTHFDFKICNSTSFGCCVSLIFRYIYIIVCHKLKSTIHPQTVYICWVVCNDTVVTALENVEILHYGCEFIMVIKLICSQYLFHHIITSF